jgi:hypothetical protein
VGLVVQNDRSDPIQVSQVNTTFAISPMGVTNANLDASVPVAALIPPNGLGVVTVDLLSADDSQTLVRAFEPTSRWASRQASLMATITLQGSTPSGDQAQSNAFTFPIRLDFSWLPAAPDGVSDCGTTLDANGNPTTVLEFVNAPCGEPQDAAVAVCVPAGSAFPDGGS